jgi:hypothetical protein
MAGLDSALHGQAQAQAELTAAGVQEAQVKVVTDDANSESIVISGQENRVADAIDSVANEQTPEASVPAKPAPKPVIAVRGDDRPGKQREMPESTGARPGKWSDKKDASRASRDDRGLRKEGKPTDRKSSVERAHSTPWQDAPRLGDAAFRAQRDALEHAQMALKKLASQAHGEALTQFLTAWEKRDASVVPTTQDLGSRVSAAMRSAWISAIENSTSFKSATTPAEALLRVEMAAELPSPAEHIGARRALQLQMLTRRNDPSPQQTWGQDVAAVLAGPCNPTDARRVQSALKVLLKR